MYTEKVMDHFRNPRNMGVIDDADGIGEVGNPTCGDMMRITIKVKDDVLEDVKFQTLGCGAAVATSSMVTEMAIGQDAGRSHGDLEQGSGGGARWAASGQDALLEPRRRRSARRHQGLPGEAPGHRLGFLPTERRSRLRDPRTRRARCHTVAPGSTS